MKEGDRMGSVRYTVVLLMLLLVPALLFGAITAVYTPEPYLVLQAKPGPFTSDTTFGAKLGTLIVTTTDGDKIYAPTWGSTDEVEYSAILRGPMRSYPGGPFEENATHTFHIMSVAYPYGYPGTPVIRVVQSPHSPIVSWFANTVDANPFRVELYLMSTNSTYQHTTTYWRPASYFQLNAVYTLPITFNPVFSFVSANDYWMNVGWMMNNGEPNPSHGSYVSVNGVAGADSTPIVQSSAYTDPDNPGQPGMTYGDPPQMVSYSVFLTNQSTEFNLADAIGSKRKDVNTMSITVSNGTAGANYTQKVIFTDLTPVSTSAEFRMLPEESGPNPIPFKLYFDSTEVVKGEAITWNNLQNGSNNTKTIRIGGINQNTIDSLASGTYTDTISVEIQNP